MGYSFVDVDEVEPSGPGGAVRFLRRELGATAFGFNWFELPPNTSGREHDEAATGQEEVMVILAGSGTLTVDGEELELRKHRIVRLDPESNRLVVAGDDGIAFMTIGSPRETPYVPRGPF